MLKLGGGVYREMQVEEPKSPEFGLPKLEPNIDDLNDKQLMNLFVQFTRWTDFFQSQLAIEDVYERYADARVRRLEAIYMLQNRSVTIGPRGGRQEDSMTFLRAGMEEDAEITKAREEQRVAYARRKLKQLLFEAAERDAAVLSRELTRRTDVKNPGYRRADRGTP